MSGQRTRSSRVKLCSIPSLTFYNDRDTIQGRRGPAVPQLTCEGKACYYAPEVIHCTSIGGEGSDLDWKCEASLPQHVRLGRTTVSCEGWDNSEDPYILKGSCGLTYNLVSDSALSDDSYSPPSSGSNLVPYLIFGSILLYVLYQLIFKRDPHRGPALAGYDSGDDNPPPPYQPAYQPSKSYPAASAPAPSRSNTNFWTGLATGAGASLAVNALMNRDNQQTRRTDGRLDRDYARGEGGSRAPVRSMPRFDSGSSSMRTSTGFGGTSNR